MLPNKRDRITLLVGVLGLIAILAIGWLVLISPQHSKANDLKAQANDSTGQIALMSHHLSDLRAASTKVAQFQDELAVDQRALPATDGIPAFLRSLQATADASGVGVTSVSVSDPKSTTSTATATTAPATGSGQSAGGATYEMDISLSATGPLDSLIAFMKAMQQGDRAALVTAAALDTSTGSLPTLTATLTVFVAPAGH